MTSPLTDSLTASQSAIVARYRRDPRPTYYSASVDTEIEISQDLEALLILTPRNIKEAMISFIEDALNVSNAQNEDDFALYEEMASIRADNYVQVNRDTGSKVIEYDNARREVGVLLERLSRQGSDSAASNSAVVLPDLSAFFSSVRLSYSEFDRPDALAIHDRISDSGYVLSIENGVQTRARELSSWATVFTQYLNV